jgi:hypothetical protein
MVPRPDAGRGRSGWASPADGYHPAIVSPAGSRLADHDAGDEFDARTSPVLQREIPTLSAAFDGPAMGATLQAALFGDSNPRYTIVRCQPGKATYLPGEGGIVRYQLAVEERGVSASFPALVTGRLLSRGRDVAAFFEDRVAPLAARVRDREELRPFATVAAVLEPLDMVVHAFPIDPELPTLVAATDPQRMAAVFAETPPWSSTGSTIDGCRVELVQYRRRHRCVLRYTVASAGPGGEAAAPTVVYGKVADRDGTDVGPMITALRAGIGRNGKAPRFQIPRWLGSPADLQLTLLAALPGEPRIKELLEARTGAGPAAADGPALEDAIDECAGIAADLHGADVVLGAPRTLDDDLHALRAAGAAVHRVSPAFASRCDGWLRRIKALAEASTPMAPRLAHGDFTLSQAISDGTGAGLVDFDTMCRAEPALDLGQFLAYIRFVVATEGRAAAPPAAAAIAEPLCTRFLDAYVAQSPTPVDARQLRARVAVYELASLVRIALHSWYQFKPARVAHVVAVLDERSG